MVLEAFLKNLIDYAGLFPPAAFDLPTAARNYAAYLQGEHRWMLGRFVVPVARLDELEQVLAEVPQDEAWRVSALAGADVASDHQRIDAFNQRNESRAVIDAVESKAASLPEIEATARAFAGIESVYCELPLANDLVDLVRLLNELGLRAKVRTGGVTADAFPSAQALAHFIKTCAEEDVAFKATAGLHHPVRSIQRLTYEPNSESALMHGFLNLFVAAGLAQFGVEEETLVEVLEERDPQAFYFDTGGVRWREHDLVRAHVRNTRALFAISFGSCSFEEPIEDLQRMGLL